VTLPPDSRLRIVLADDNPVVRHGLRAIISGHPDLEVVGEAVDGRQAVELVRRLKPDLTLLDVRMPGLDGFGAAAELTPEFQVLMISYSDDPDEVARALAAGAQGYLVYGRFEVDELLRAVRGAVRGESHLSPSVAPVAVRLAQQQLKATAAGRPPESARPARLTAREAEVMEAVCTGMTNAQIAQALFLSENTVRNHLTHIHARLGAHSRAHAIALWTGRAVAPAANR
jgi:DNA-binding NarL/FixJ family response regulator